LEIEDLTTGETFHDYAEVWINATGWLKYTPLISRLMVVHGNGQIFQVYRNSKEIYSTRQTGRKIIRTKGKE
jgi:hypothetical protein